MTDGTNETESQKKDAACRKRQRVLAIVLAILIAAAMFAAGWLGATYAVDARLRKLGMLMNTLESQYYEEIDTDAYYEAFYEAISPDPYSVYLTKEDCLQEQEKGDGKNTAVGIYVHADDAGPRIYNVEENSPACLAGLREGMYIVGWSASDGAVERGSFDAFSEFLAAQTGECVLYADYDAGGVPSAENAFSVCRMEFLSAYCIYRDSEAAYAFRGDTQTVLTDVTQSYGAADGLDAQTAYIRLKSFNGNCAREFEDCLELMKSRGRTNLVLDLRGNGGGYLSDVQSISAHLLRNADGKDPVVIRAEKRDGTVIEYRATGNDFGDYFRSDSEIAVLADAGTASASECLIGALVDYGTVGYDDIYLVRDADTGECRTYGKGIMQQRFDFPDGSALRLTTAKIYWPNGSTIHGTGVTPQYPAAGAHAVTAPSVAGEEDVFLDQVFSALNA